MVQSGIWNDGSEYAVSIIVSGGYRDDVDNGSSLLYTGQGGRNAVTGKQVEDQVLKRGNKGLFNSMKFKYPVRVIRGYQVENGPDEGFRYDGLFLVTSARIEHSVDGPMIWRFVLEKLEEDTWNKQISNNKKIDEINNTKLNKSAYLVSKRFGKLNIWKSCPKCSKLNTEEMEFKLFVQCDEDNEWNYHSSDFGFTKKRETATNPLGGQSLCKICRSGKRLSGLTRRQLKGEIICFGNWNEIENSF